MNANQPRIFGFINNAKFWYQANQLVFPAARSVSAGCVTRVDERRARWLFVSPAFPSLLPVTHFTPPSVPCGCSRGELPLRVKSVSSSDPGNRQTFQQSGSYSQRVTKAGQEWECSGKGKLAFVSVTLGFSLWLLYVWGYSLTGKRFPRVISDRSRELAGTKSVEAELDAHSIV